MVSNCEANRAYLHEFEWQDKPWPSDEGNIEESDAVTKHPRSQNFDVSHFVDQLEAEHVCRHFAEVIQNRGDTKECWTAAEVLRERFGEKDRLYKYIGCVDQANVMTE